MPWTDDDIDRLRAYMCGFAQAINHRAWDTEGTIMIVEPREHQQRGWKAGRLAFNAAESAERAQIFADYGH